MRAAYLLGDVLGLTDVEAAPICEITPAAYRQRLARARRTLRQVIDNRCGVVDPANPCRCGRQIASALDVGYLNPDRLPLATHPRRPGDIVLRARLHRPPLDPTRTAQFERVADQIDVAVLIGDLYRADRFAAPDDVWQQLRHALPDLLADQLPAREPAERDARG